MTLSMPACRVLVASLLVMLATLNAWPQDDKWQVIPGATTEITAVIREIRAGGRAETEWEALIAKAQLQTFKLLVVMIDETKFEKGVEHGLELLLQSVTTRATLEYLQSLPEKDRKEILDLLDYSLFRTPEPTRKQMLISYALGLDRQAVFHARNLWYVTQDPLAIQISALAVRRSDLRSQTWETGGQRLFRSEQLNHLRAAIELSFYVALAGKLHSRHVVPRLLEIANVRRVDPDVTRILTDELLAQGFAMEVQELLSGTTDPGLMYQMLRLFNQQLEVEMPKEDWDKIYAAADSEKKLFLLAGVVSRYQPEKVDEIHARILEMPPTNSVIDALVLQDQASRSEAEGDFVQAADLLDRYVAARQVGDADDKQASRLQQRAKALRQLPRFDPRPLLAAREAARKQDYPTAIAKFKEVLTAHPELRSVFLQLLAVLEAANDNQEYLRIAGDLLKLKPATPEEELRWAHYSVDVLDTKNAIVYVNQYLQQDPDSPRAYRIRGAAYERECNYDQALADYQTAAQKGLRRDLERLAGLLEARRGNTSKAIAQFEDHLLAVNPDDDYARLWLHLLRRRGKTADRNDLEAYIRARGEALDPWVAQLFAYCLGSCSRKDLLAVADQAPTTSRQRGRQCEAAFYLGLAALADGAVDTARSDFRRCLDFGITTYVEHVWADAELRRLK